MTQAQAERPDGLLRITTERYGLGVLLVAVVAVFSTLPRTGDLFASHANFTVILGGEVPLCVIAIAFTLPLVVGQLDLSIASIAGMASIAGTAAMSRFDQPLVVAILVAILFGAAAGAFNGFLIAVLGLDCIIVTLAVMTVIAGLVQWYTDGISINTGVSATLTDFGSLSWFGVPRIAFLLVLVVGLVWYVVEKTPFGRHLRMIGSNRTAARLVGIPVVSTTFAVFVLAGALAGAGGMLLTARSGGANPQEGPGLLLAALAAVYLGATTVQPGKFNVAGTVVGVFFLALAVSGLTLAGVPPFVSQLFDGGALLVAVVLSRFLGRNRVGTVGT
ncbi:MAG: ABC transporter permease [Nocardioidaceae bacterium]|nr:ABC transporter permease [Nocardioidaceae bacterium]